MFYQIIQYLNPISNVDDIYSAHLITVKQLKWKKSSKKLKFKIFTTFFALKGVHLATLFGWSFPELQRLLQYDLITDVVETPGVNIAAAALFTMMAVIYFRFCSSPPVKNNTLLNKIVLNQEKTFFIYHYKNRNQKPFAEIIRNRFNLAYNVIGFVKYIFGFISLISHAVLVYKLNYFIQNNNIYLKLLYNIIQHLTGFWVIFYLLSYASIIALITSIGFIQLNILIFKLKQMFVYLKTARSFTIAKFTFYRKWQVEVLQYFSEFNRMYGWIFAVFLLFNCPVNVYFVSILVYNNNESTSLLGSLYMTTYTVLQLFSLFILHWYLITISDHFHKPILLLLRLSIFHRQKFKNFIFKIKVDNFIAAFYPKDNLYGVTYARFGRVTMQTFVKFLLLWCKFLMITYKITMTQKYSNE